MALYEGVWVALVTPFKNHEIDEPALLMLVDDLAGRGVKGFVPLGTTGEASTLTDDERRRVITLCVEAAGDVSVAPGCGTNNTAQTVARVKEAEALGASGAMVITPYYNKPTQEGLLAHFRAAADASDLPVLMYNVPSRTGVNMLPDTVAHLADHPNIESIKEASGNLDQISEICAKVEGRMTVLAGDDSLTLPILSVGGEGIVSVVGNLFPEPLVEIVDAYWKDDPTRALARHRQIYAVCKAMFLETNPGPVKCALWLEGKIQNELRLPMVPVKNSTRDAINSTVRLYKHELTTAHV
jgi:4-hydroxy-tetrahydrodipicolinate synthase